MQLSILKSIKPKNYLKKEKKSRLKFIELCYRGEEKQGEKREEKRPKRVILRVREKRKSKRKRRSERAIRAMHCAQERERERDCFHFFFFFGKTTYRK